MGLRRDTKADNFLHYFSRKRAERMTKPLFIRVHLLDPITEEEFPVFDRVAVEVVKIKSRNPTVISDAWTLTPDPQSKIFHIDLPSQADARANSIRVGFSDPNFSKPLRRFVSPHGIDPASFPIYCLSNFPDLESYGDVRYRANAYFPPRCLWSEMTIDRPLILKVPIHRLYNIGHRGAPLHFPENTIPSFQKALDLGANGLEFDLCFTKDKKIVILHDPKPSPSRAMVEKLPYELVHLEFLAKNGEMVPVAEYHVANLSIDQVRQIYYYCRTEGLQRVDETIPDLDEFLSFVRQRVDQLELLYFDVKNPDWNEKRDAQRFVEYGSRLGSALRQCASLPKKMVICNANPQVLQLLKLGVQRAGETRCEFAYDAAGGPAALFEEPLERICSRLPEPFRWIVRIFLGLLKALLGKRLDPLKVAKKMKNSVVAIGRFLRPGNLEEIEEAVHDRDYNPSSPVKTVIHWTLNDPGQMYRSLSAGVNGIVTDKPDGLREFLERLEITIS